MRVTIADLTADNVIYRDLEPCDPRLPAAATLQTAVGLPPGPPPRKRDRGYALMVRELARAAQALRNGPALTTLAVIGDTANDRILSENLFDLGELAIYGFLGVDRPGAAPDLRWEGPVALADRWAALPAWAAELEARGVDWACTALLIDIDKTLLGPRGRADAAIDEARADAALAVAHELLGPHLDMARFRAIYAELCRGEWHPYTLDNQDYVAATALFAAVDLLDLAALKTVIANGQPPAFHAVLSQVAPSPQLIALHAALLERAAAGDPTPFKDFRRAELAATVARMADGRLSIGAELYHLAAQLAERGMMCLAASDKPAESALPSEAQIGAGMTALHHTPAELA